MFYREAGQYKTSYRADQALFPILQDRIGIVLILAAAFFVVPLTASDFMINAVMTPFLIFSLAAIGLNLLTGYTGLLSLGTGAFMGVGAFACYKLTTFFPDVNIIVLIVCSGFFSAAVGIVFGLPSLRIKGFYLAVATLAAQFFLSWCFIRIPWLYNYNVSAAIEVPTRTLFGIPITGPTATRDDALSRRALDRGGDDLARLQPGARPHRPHVDGGARHGHRRRADRHPALPTKLLAFAVSSFYCGVAGAMLVFLWYGSAESDSFNINQSFLILFMVIIGGLGSLLGSFFGAALIYVLPIVLRMIPDAFGLPLTSATVEHITFITVGALIIFFLIVEPTGLARLWQIGKQKLRVWPFPY